MPDKNMELRSETSDNEEKKVEMKEENEHLEEGNEVSKIGNSQLMQQEEPAESTIAISTSQSADVPSYPELEEAEYYVPNWLIEVLAFIYRKEMANSSLSTLSKLFQLLCWPKLHQKVKPHKIPHLECIAIRDRDELGNFFRAQFQRLETYGYEIIPIASTPAPHYIDGITSIALEFVDEQVVDFIKNIDRLLQNCDLNVFFNLISRGMDKKPAASMDALLEYLVNKIFSFTISYHGREQKPYLNDFNRLFPGILDQIQFLCFNSFLHIDDFDTTLKWLTEQSIDGKQKIIKFDYRDQKCMAMFISRIGEEFSNSNLPSKFFIYFGFLFDQVEFTLENTRTNEILTFYRRQNPRGRGFDVYYMARYPKEEEHWKEAGQNKMERAKLSDSTIYIEA